MQFPRFALPALLTALFTPIDRALPAQDPPATLRAGTAAPDFVSVDFAGREVHLADQAGKIVVLDFWATWCGPCLESLPHVQQVAAARKADGVVVLAVCTSDSRARFQTWMKDNAAKYPDIVFTCDPFDRGSKQFDERASAKHYRVSGLPTKFVVGKDGKIAATIVGSEPDDVRLEAGLARAGLAVDAALVAKGEAQERRVAKEEAADAAEAAANPPPSFFPQFGPLLQSGKPVADVGLVGANGKEFTLASMRGKPTVVVLAWHEIVPTPELNEIAQRYGGYDVQTLAMLVLTPRGDFDGWVKDNADIAFKVGVDPAGKFEADPDHPDPEAEMAFHQKTAVGKLFGGDMFPAMPIGLVLDGEGRFVGGFALGPDLSEGLGNLLLRAGCKLKQDDMPKQVAPAEAFAVAPRPEAAKEALVERLAIGAAAPDFTSHDASDRAIALSDYAGKIVVLDFWATWCGPCKASLPHTQEVAAKYKDQGVVVLANCTSDARRAFEAWLQQHQGDYPDIVFTHDRAEKKPERVSRALYGVAGIPQQFVIGKDGKVAAIVGGYLEGEVLLEAALAQAGVKVDAATLRQAAEDQKKRDAMAAKSAKTSVPGMIR